MWAQRVRMDTCRLRSMLSMLPVTRSPTISFNSHDLDHTKDGPSSDSVHACKNSVSAFVGEICSNWNVVRSDCWHRVCDSWHLVNGNNSSLHLPPIEGSFSIYGRDRLCPGALKSDLASDVKVATVKVDTSFSRALRECSMRPGARFVATFNENNGSFGCLDFPIA
jgi:hypothetical protein